MKKFLCMFLTFLMIILAFPLNNALAESHITKVSAAKGSSYTKYSKLAEALDAIFSGDTNIYSNSSCSSEVSMPVGYSLNKDKTYYVKSKATGSTMSGKQCYIYANAVYNKLFNETVVHGESFSHSEKIISGGGNSVSYNQFNSAGVKCGAYMRTTSYSNGKYNGKSGHSLIILSYDSSSISYLEGNADSKGLIRITKQSWSEFNEGELSGRSRYICHIVQPTQAIYDELYFTCTNHSYTLKNESTHPHAEYKLCYCGSKIYTGNHKKQSDCSYCQQSFLYSFKTVDGQTVSTYSKNYDITVSIISQPGCNNTSNLIQTIVDNPTRLKNNVQVLYVDTVKNTKQMVTNYKNSFESSKIKFCYDLTNNANKALWHYAEVAGFNGSITLPIIAFTKKDGTVFKITQGDIDPDYFFQLANGDLSQDMNFDLNISGKENYSYATEVLKKLNDLRKRLNLQPLTMDKNLSYAAMQRAAEISVYYSHSRPNGTSCFTVLSDSGKHAENIAIGQMNPTAVMNSWTNSSGHYYNMTRADFQSVGIGCFTSSNGYLCWVQLFSSSDPTEITKTGTKTVTRIVKANAAHLSLSVYIDKNAHGLKTGETTNFTIVNTNKGYNYVVQNLKVSDFSFKANNSVISVYQKGYCKVNKTGKTIVTVQHRQSESAKNTNTYTIGHTYSHSCDTSCNECQEKRTIKHTYSNNCDTVCNVCKATRKITHAYKTTTTKATLTKNGNVVKKCTVCGKKTTSTINKIKSIKLSKTSYTYDGNEKKPSIKVTDSAGKTISSKYYTVKYASGRKKVGTYKVIVTMKGNYNATKTLTFKINPATLNSCKLSAIAYTYDGKVKTPSVTVKNASGKKLSTASYTVTYQSGRKNVGSYKVTIKGKGNYTGKKVLTFKINPKAASVNDITTGSKKLTVKLNRSLRQSTGYQIQYSTNKSFKNARTKTITSYKTSSTALTGLKAKTTYYVRVRTYKTVGNTKYYSNWSSYKQKKTK